MDFNKFRKALKDMDKKENAEYLDDSLKHLLDPSKSIKDVKCDSESDFVKCIIGGDLSRDEFMEICRFYLKTF